jgi:cytochrome c-type biogenesis protein CcmH/NrfG
MNHKFEESFHAATSLRDEGKLEEVLIVLEQLSTESPERAVVWLVMGGVQMSLARYAAAKESFAPRSC